MKNKKILFHLLLVLGFGVSNGYAQESSNASGGEASGSGGTVSYSIGQIIYSIDSGSNGIVYSGVQQPYEIYTVGIEEKQTNISLKAFPNPTSDYLTLAFDDFSNEQISYHLLDLKGKIVLVGTITDAITTFNLGPYVKGTYFIKITKESNEIKTFKVIKN